MVYQQRPSQYLRLLSDDEPFVSWRRRVGGEVAAYWCFALDRACFVASLYEQKRQAEQEKRNERASRLRALGVGAIE